MNFLDEQEALPAIKQMLAQTDRAILAVAFWGAGAVDALGLNQNWKSLRIVCNLQSGACNPLEIKKLIELGPNVLVRSNPSLHGKVYLGRDHFVLGSSNASSNGLVVEGPKTGWSEANIFSGDAALFEKANSWAVERFEEAVEITDIMLNDALKLWKERAAMAPGLPNNLLDAVRKHPKHVGLDNVYVIGWYHDVTPEDISGFNETVRENPALEGTSFYAGWGGTIPAGAWLIDFDLTATKPKFTRKIWHVLDLPPGPFDLTLVREKAAVQLLGIGELKLSRADLVELGRRIKAASVGDRANGGKLVKIADLMGMA